MGGRKNNAQKAPEGKKLSTARQYELKLHIQRLLMIDIDRKASNSELWDEYVVSTLIIMEYPLDPSSHTVFAFRNRSSRRLWIRSN